MGQRDTGHPWSHRIAAVLFLPPFFIGILFCVISINDGDGADGLRLLFEWWKFSVVVYAVVRVVLFFIKGHWR